MTQFDTASPKLIASVQAGASIEEAARHAGVPAATVRRWLRDGRKGRRKYEAFAVAVDGARGERKRAERALKDGPLTNEEAAQLLARAARKGSVPALRLWYERVAVDDASKRDADARALLAQVFGDD
jgi:transposase-like protein